MFENNTTGIGGDSIISGINRKYLLFDHFRDNRGVGVVNGSKATDGKNTRFVTDTNNCLSIEGGKLVVNNTASTSLGLQYNAYNRTNGLLLFCDYTIISNGNTTFTFGDGTNCMIKQYSLALSVQLSGVEVSLGYNLVVGVTYNFCVVIRSTGCFYYIKGGVFTNWTLLFFQGTYTNTVAPKILVAWWTSAKSWTNGFIKVPRKLWLPSPIISDGFIASNATSNNGRLTDGLGHPEGVNKTVGSGGENVIWTGTNGTIQSNKLINTPIPNSNITVNGTFDADTDWTKNNALVTISGGKANFATGTNWGQGIYQNILTVGKWYRGDVVLSGTGQVFLDFGGTQSYNAFGSGLCTQVKYGVYSNGTGSNFVGTVDNATVQELTLSQLFNTVDAKTPNVNVSVDIVAPQGAWQSGIVLSLDSNTNPLSFILVFLDRTLGNIRAYKCLNGTYTSISTTTVTYVAGAKLNVIKNGTNLMIFYNNNSVGSMASVSSGYIDKNTLCGTFSTHETNTFDNFLAYANGNENQYSALDRIISDKNGTS